MFTTPPQHVPPDFCPGHSLLHGMGLAVVVAAIVSILSAPDTRAQQNFFGRLDSIGHLDVPTDNFRCDIAIQPGLAVLTTASDGAFVIDISDPRHPQLRSQISTESYTPDVQLSDSIVYLALGPGSGVYSGKSILIADVSDPTSPQVLSSYGREDFQDCQSLYLDGHTLYAGSYDGKRLEIIDVSHPDLPVLLGQWRHPQADDIVGAYIHEIFVRDGIAYLAHWDGGFQIIDVSNPAAPEFLGQVLFPATTCHAVWVGPDLRAFVIDLFSTPPFSALRVIDVADPTDPQILSSQSWCGVPLHFISGGADDVMFVAHHSCGLWAAHVDGLGAVQTLDSAAYPQDILGFWGTANDGRFVYGAHMERGLYIYEFLSARRGDFNADHQHNITDVVFLIGMVLRNGGEPALTREIADWNCDGRYDMLDVTTAIDYVFRAGPEPCSLGR